jgi:hypothetical protein
MESRPAQEYVWAWDKFNHHKNKENRPRQPASAEAELKMKMSGTLLHPLAANGSWARNEEDPQKYLLSRIEICPRRLLRKSMHAQGTPLAALVTLTIGKNASHGQMPIQIT